MGGPFRVRRPKNHKEDPRRAANPYPSEWDNAGWHRRPPETGEIMGKRSFSILVALALVAGVFSIAPAKAQSTDAVKFFLRSTGCSAADTNFDYLSIVDADDAIECFYTGSGARNEIGSQTGTLGAAGNNAVTDRTAATRYWDSTDGGPISLDASRPVTGEIYTSGGSCAVTGACSPQGLGIGEVILDIAVVGLSGGAETELGTQTETFNATPGAPRLTTVSIQPAAALTGTTFETIELRTWMHGKSAGHGVVKTNGSASSFLSVPTVPPPVIKSLPPGKTKPGKTPPGKGDPPGKGKKKGCDKGNGKKKGACPASVPAAHACPPFVPGDMGADADTSVVTDAATAAAPVKVEYDAEMGGPGDPALPVEIRDLRYQNVQVDTAGTSAALNVKVEFPDRHDFDLYVYDTSGSEVDHSGDFNTIIESPVHACGGTSCDSGSNFESVLALPVDDCGGFTIESVGYLTTGGNVTISMWLGEADAAPAAARDASALFYEMTGL